MIGKREGEITPEVGKATQFKKGASGNPNGRLGNLKPFTDALRKIALSPGKKQDKLKVDELAQQVWAAAEMGNLKAVKLIFETVQGRPAQEITGADGEPLNNTPPVFIVKFGDGENEQP